MTQESSWWSLGSELGERLGGGSFDAAQARLRGTGSGTLTTLDGLEGGPRGLFWDKLSKSAPRFSFSTDMSLQNKEGRGVWDPAPWQASRDSLDLRDLPPYPVHRASVPGEAPGLKVPVPVALGMSLRSSRTQVATSMFICRAR